MPDFILNGDDDPIELPTPSIYIHTCTHMQGTTGNFGNFQAPGACCHDENIKDFLGNGDGYAGSDRVDHSLDSGLDLSGARSARSHRRCAFSGQRNSLGNEPVRSRPEIDVQDMRTRAQIQLVSSGLFAGIEIRATTIQTSGVRQSKNRLH